MSMCFASSSLLKARILSKESFLRLMSMSTCKYTNHHKNLSHHVNVHLAPVLLDVVGRLSEAGIQGNIGKVLSKDKSAIIQTTTIRTVLKFFRLTYIHPRVFGLTDKVKIDEGFEDVGIGEA